MFFCAEFRFALGLKVLARSQPFEETIPNVSRGQCAFIGGSLGKSSSGCLEVLSRRSELHCVYSQLARAPTAGEQRSPSALSIV